MTELVRSQINIICVMCLCGIGTGLMNSTVNSFMERRKPRKLWRRAAKVVFYLCAAFLAGEALYCCNNGKVTFLAGASLLCGLWLWKKIFCDILTPIGGENVEKKG